MKCAWNLFATAFSAVYESVGAVLALVTYCAGDSSCRAMSPDKPAA